MTKAVDWESRIGRRLRLRDLHVFFAVVQSGSMAKAATHLKITQPSVSKAIGDLEEALGVRLFDRSTRGVEPTIYGDVLVKCGSVVFDELRQGIRHIEFLADPTVGELRIGCPDVVGAVVIPPVLERFTKRYPRVVLISVSSIMTHSPLLRFFSFSGWRGCYCHADAYLTASSTGCLLAFSFWPSNICFASRQRRRGGANSAEFGLDPQILGGGGDCARRRDEPDRQKGGEFL